MKLCKRLSIYLVADIFIIPIHRKLMLLAFNVCILLILKPIVGYKSSYLVQQNQKRLKRHKMYFVNEIIDEIGCCVGHGETECETVKSTSWIVLSHGISVTMQQCLLFANMSSL